MVLLLCFSCAYLASFNFHRIVINRKAHTPDAFGDKCMHSREMTNICWDLNVDFFFMLHFNLYDDLEPIFFIVYSW